MSGSSCPSLSPLQLFSGCPPASAVPEDTQCMCMHLSSGRTPNNKCPMTHLLQLCSCQSWLPRRSNFGAAPMPGKPVHSSKQHPAQIWYQCSTQRWVFSEGSVCAYRCLMGSCRLCSCPLGIMQQIFKPAALHLEALKLLTQHPLHLLQCLHTQTHTTCVP